MAKKACDEGAVIINGKSAKASTLVAINDTIELNAFGYLNVFKITQLPQGNVAKKDTALYYELLRRDKVIPD